MENVPGDPAPPLRASQVELVDGDGQCQMRLTPGAIQIMGSMVFIDKTGVIFGELGSQADRSWFHLGVGGQLRLASHPDEATLIVASGSRIADTPGRDEGTVEVTIEARSGWTERDEASPASGGLSIRLGGDGDEGLRLQSESNRGATRQPRPPGGTGGYPRHCR